MWPAVIVAILVGFMLLTTGKGDGNWFWFVALAGGIVFVHYFREGIESYWQYQERERVRRNAEEKDRNA